MARTQEYKAQEVADALREANGVVARAAKALDCAPKTVYRYADRYVTVEQAMEEARMDLAAEAETHLVAMMRDADSPAQRYKAVKDILRNFHPNGFTDERTENEHSGDAFSINIHPPDADE